MIHTLIIFIKLKRNQSKLLDTDINLNKIMNKDIKLKDNPIIVGGAFNLDSYINENGYYNTYINLGHINKVYMYICKWKQELENLRMEYPGIKDRELILLINEEDIGEIFNVLSRQIENNRTKTLNSFARVLDLKQRM